MKNRTRPIFLVILAFVILSSNNIANVNACLDENELFILNDNSGTTWSRTLVNGILIFPTLHILNDSIVVAGFHMDFYEHLSELFATRYNENGTVQWEFKHEVDVENEHSLVDHENNIIMFALIYDNSEVKELFVKINQEGALLISKYIPELTECFIDSIALDSHNCIYVAGYNLGNSTNFGSHHFLMKLDNNGDYIYSINDIYSRDVYVDKFDNIYLSSGSIYKFNTNGSILWKIDSYSYLHSDNAENVFAMNSNYLIKLNSSGDILNKTKIKSGSIRTFSQNHTYFFYSNEKFILKYDSNCALRWNASLEEYLEPSYAPRYITSDSHENVYIVSDSNDSSLQKGFGLNILKLNSSGDFVSQVFWGGNHVEYGFEVSFDSQENLYLLARCRYINIWNKYIDFMVLVKNPSDGGIPPAISGIDVGFIVVFTTLGVSSFVSIIIIINVEKNRQRNSKSHKEQIQ